MPDNKAVSHEEWRHAAINVSLGFPNDFARPNRRCDSVPTRRRGHPPTGQDLSQGAERRRVMTVW